jgi:superfamily I DNA and RNA helicase
MNLVNRDKNPKERERIVRQQQNLRELVESLKRGEIHKGDLPDDVLDQLREKLL